MNAEKARDFFSAYYEDSLDAGLRQSFETRLRADAALAQEYRGFVSAMESLSTLRDEEIEIPQYLSDRIATRLESVQAKRSTSFFNFTFFQRLSLGALAVLAIGGTFVGFLAKPGSEAAQGGLVPVITHDTIAPFEVTQVDGRVLLKNKGGDQVLTVTVGGVTDKLQLTEEPAELKNAQLDPATFYVGQEGTRFATIVIVPGKTVVESRKGSGTLLQMAQDAATVYRLPIALTVQDPTLRTSWSFRTGEAPQGAISAAIKDAKATADLSGSGVLTIQGH